MWGGRVFSLIINCECVVSNNCNLMSSMSTSVMFFVQLWLNNNAACACADVNVPCGRCQLLLKSRLNLKSGESSVTYRSLRQASSSSMTQKRFRPTAKSEIISPILWTNTHAKYYNVILGNKVHGNWEFWGYPCCEWVTSSYRQNKEWTTSILLSSQQSEMMPIQPKRAWAVQKMLLHYHGQRYGSL